jgi:hypothetical protein
VLGLPPGDTARAQRIAGRGDAVQQAPVQTRVESRKAGVRDGDVSNTFGELM